MSSDVSSENSFLLMKKWIQTCMTDHDLCRKTQKKRGGPARLIDVHALGSSESDDICLVETWTPNADWVALSHCWGGSSPVCTTSDTLDSFFLGIKIDQVPQTFRDTMTITRRLGFRYVWIDSLCIIQNRESDWLRESAKMQDIYGHAVLTVIAECSPNSHVGIFNSTNQFRREIVVYRPQIRAFSKTHNIEGLLRSRKPLDQPFHTSLDDRSPVSKRAWTLQEEILSPRRLRFAEQRMYWSCSQACATEATPDFLCPCISDIDRLWRLGTADRVVDISYVQNTSLDIDLNSWYAIVDEFVFRKVSYEQDRLAAIAALAKQVGRTDYAAGLWISDIRRGLAWSVDGANAERTSVYVAPSWSWASIDFSCSTHSTQSIYGDCRGGVLHDCDHVDGYDADLLDFSLSHTSDDYFVTTCGGFLEMFGNSLIICDCILPNTVFDIRPVSHNLFNGLILNQDVLRGDYDVYLCFHGEASNHRHMTLFQIGAWRSHPDWKESYQGIYILALVLYKVDDDRNEYRRVGIVAMREDNDILAEEWERRAFKII
ncbi:MAG: hypothetical protein Q9165_001278 [Trypethelium subeluteriae]